MGQTELNYAGAAAFLFSYSEMIFEQMANLGVVKVKIKFITTM